MDARFVALGNTIIVVSAILIAYSLMTGAGQLLGVAFSTSILGVVVLVVGVSYHEPLSESLQIYSRSLHSALVRIHEDLGFTGSSLVEGCRDGDRVYIVFSRKPIPCDRLSPGLGSSQGQPYLALLVEGFNLSNIYELVARYGVAGSITVSRRNNRISVDVVRPSRNLFSGEWAPLNLLQILVVSGIVKHYGVDIVVEKQEYSGEVYHVECRVLES